MRVREACSKNNDIYRVRLFHLKPYKNKLKISLYSLKNKGDKTTEKFDKKEMILDTKHPQNPFYSKLIEAFDLCRVRAIKKWFPEFSDRDIKALLIDGNIERNDVERVINKY